MNSKVITYQSPSGQRITLTEHMVRLLESGNAWPKDSRGDEYCTVYHGWHEGRPSITEPDLMTLINHQRAAERA